MNLCEGRVSGRTNSGFSLIELLIVVGIIAIIAAVGYPSYTEYVTRSHRQAGKNWLYAVADRQEQYFLDNKRYAPTLTDLGYADDVIWLDDDAQLTDVSDADRKYAVILVNTAARTYTAVAVPMLVQAQRDVSCGALLLTHQGEQQQTGPADNCW